MMDPPEAGTSGEAAAMNTARTAAARHLAVCDGCGRTADAAELRCHTCGGTIAFTYPPGRASWDPDRRGLWRYRSLLPTADGDDVVSLGEGGTPLLRSTMHTAAQVHLKDETRNPTGSHKDRQICVAINHARALGRNTSVLVSSGSTGLANAAYCARAGLRSIVFMAQGVPADRVYPVFALGSTVVEVRGQVDDLIDRLNELAVQRGLYHSSTARICNPYQAEGAKTIAFEVVEDLGRVPDWVIVPLGGGGTLAAMWRGFTELSERSEIDRLPRMAGVTPRSFNALERALERGYRTDEELQSLPHDPASASIQVKLAHAYPPDGADALAAIRESDGLIVSVTDEEALREAKRCSTTEGLYVEPSSGAGLAGLQRLLDEGRIAHDEVAVAVLSGSGFRETATTMDLQPLEREVLDMADLEPFLRGVDA